MDKMLRISRLRKEFGGIIALQGVEFSMESNNIKSQWCR